MSTTYAAYDPTALIAGDYPVRSRVMTVAAGSNAAGAVLLRGTLLGRVTATDKYIPSVKTASDGSQVPAAILAADIDASVADVQTPGYQSGEFAFEEMTVDASWTLQTLQAVFRQAIAPIFIRSVGLVS